MPQSAVDAVRDSAYNYQKDPRIHESSSLPWETVDAFDDDVDDDDFVGWYSAGCYVFSIDRRRHMHPH